MKSTDSLNKFGTLIGASASSTDITTIPATQATAGDGTASIALAFPPETFIPRSAGGEPPRGADMNGFLNLLSAAIQPIQAGYLGAYDADFAESIGGYPLNAIVSGSSVGIFWVSTEDSNTTVPGASGASWQSLFSSLSSYLPLSGGDMEGDINLADHNLTNNGGSRFYMNPNGHIQVFDNSNALRFEIGMSDGNPPYVEVPDGVLFQAPYNCVLGGGALGGQVVVPVATADNLAVQFSQLVTEQTDRANENAILAEGLSTSVQQQIDDNTYGIKTFGYNHVAGTLGAFDTNGTSWLIQLAGDYATNTSMANEATTRANEVAALQSGKANLAGGNAFTGVQTVEALNTGTTNVYGGEIRSSFQDTNGFSHFEAYINASGVRQIALGNYDGANYTTWFLDNATGRMLMPDGAVSAVTSELPTAGTITGGTYTKTPMNDGTGRSILRLHYSVSSPPGEGSITFPATFSQLPNVSLSTTDDSGNSYSVIANVRSNTITTTGFTLFAAWYAGEESGISGSSTITVTAEGIVS